MRLGNIVDACAEDCFVPEPPELEEELPKPRIFIGHGASPQWRDLKDHLHDQHGYDILAYETGSRAGHTIRDVISEILGNSSFAILVMTGEDITSDGTIRARQNVIHEIGLFQGRLGFTRSVVLKEEGTEEFSNIHGVNQIRYTKGNIKETFGDVLAVLKREFGENR
ncbi:MAG: nucleotide-binding protein [Candidatus Marinimicrobia bacterium]|nr:nucleotide-binding protein [Candidatus Neomarinimicrobiota bacterium]